MRVVTLVSTLDLSLLSCQAIAAEVLGRGTISRLALSPEPCHDLVPSLQEARPRSEKCNSSNQHPRQPTSRNGFQLSIDTLDKLHLSNFVQERLLITTVSTHEKKPILSSL